VLSKVHEQQAEYSKYTELDELAARETRLTVAVHWAEVEQVEQVGAAAAAQAAAANSRVSIVQGGLLRCEAAAAAHADTRAAKEVQRAECESAVRTAAAAATAAQQKLAAAQEPLAALTAVKRSHELQLQKYTDELHRLQK
jgi:hypothetical protein